jgi:hypothetical protein
VYTEYNKVPDYNNLLMSGESGSMGEKGDVETLGGGRISIVLDSIQVYSEGGVQSNGGPLQDETMTELH